MSQGAFINGLSQVVDCKFGKEKTLKNTYATAAVSVGLPVNPQSDAIRMSWLVLEDGRSLIR